MLEEGLILTLGKLFVGTKVFFFPSNGERAKMRRARGIVLDDGRIPQADSLEGNARRTKEQDGRVVMLSRRGEPQPGGGRQGGGVVAGGEVG